jgi:DNA mismatch endonuclease (patch repair protein)
MVAFETRDAAHRKALKKAGWDVLVVWECELAERQLADRLAHFLGPLP